MTRAQHTLRNAGNMLALLVWDAAQNRRWSEDRPERRFLVVRHARSAHFFDVLLDWLALWFPGLRPLFELHSLPPLVSDWSRYALHLPWLQDPVQNWSPWAYRSAMRLAERCDHHGVPVINRVANLTNASKADGARLIRAAGFRTAQMALIEDHARFKADLYGVPLPLFVRENWGHGGLMLRAETLEEARAIDLTRFQRPVAIELIDVRGADGLYRKYRYFVAGAAGVRQTMHVSRDWCTHGTHTIFDDTLRAEEIAFAAAPEPHHDRFVRAREALGLDFIAFDYGVDAKGEVVVWEANPYPFLHFTPGRYAFRESATRRVLALMTHLYLTRAGMPVPKNLADLLGPPVTRG